VVHRAAEVAGECVRAGDGAVLVVCANEGAFRRGGSEVKRRPRVVARGPEVRERKARDARSRNDDGRGVEGGAIRPEPTIGAVATPCTYDGEIAVGLIEGEHARCVASVAVAAIGGQRDGRDARAIGIEDDSAHEVRALVRVDERAPAVVGHADIGYSICARRRLPPIIARQFRAAKGARSSWGPRAMPCARVEMGD
jgi:hypothetical protein